MERDGFIMGENTFSKMIDGFTFPFELYARLRGHVVDYQSAGYEKKRPGSLVEQ
jgi:hypothetical protein